MDHPQEITPTVSIDVSHCRRWRLIGALALFGLSVGANPPRALSASLQSLFNGDFLTVGSCRFDNWQLLSADATTGAVLDFSLMSVNALVNDLANPGLQFASGGQLTVAGVNAIDLSFRFQVHAIGNASSFTAHALNLTGVNFGGPGGIAYISQEVVDVHGTDLGPTLVIADNVADVFQFSDDATIAPHLNLTVTMNLFLTGLEAADAINFTAFTQRFAQNGPSSLAGDFNQDKTVDGADFLRWQRGQSPNLLSPLDLTAWRNNFGKSIDAVAAAAPIPEPAGGSLMFVAMTAVCRRRRR